MPAAGQQWEKFWCALKCSPQLIIYNYRVSIPSSRICSFTASIGTSSLWNIPSAKAASALVFSKTSEKCSTLPAPEDAITGIETLSRIWLMSSISKPVLVTYEKWVIGVFLWFLIFIMLPHWKRTLPNQQCLGKVSLDFLVYMCQKHWLNEIRRK